MKYQELIQFDPVDDIIKFSKLGKVDYRQMLVKSFVCSDSYIKHILPSIVRNLDLESEEETKGIQIVGNYGTGKSHLMSLFSTIAEDAQYLDLLQSPKAKEILTPIAGKYKVKCFELGATTDLWTLVCNQIDLAFTHWGIDYSISDDKTPDMYADKLERMMAAFEDQYPDKGFMLVIDEMLSYLKGRSQPDKINSDLPVLQALGQFSDRTRFRMVFGVQEMIYQVPEFQFAADMLSHVNERYADLTIIKEDVQYIVQQRLLRKDEHQKQKIREHLQKFVSFFPDMNNQLETYVNLFPVHPSYFDNFQQIRIGKSQREILSTLTFKFKSMMDQDVPTEEPGLICYDSYWQDILDNHDLRAIPDVNRVAQLAEDINQKIDVNFSKAYASKKGIAHRIVSAIAIKTLQNDLSVQNGSTARALVTDLCPMDEMCESYDDLVELEIGGIADQIVQTTVGQFFEKDSTNEEYHFRMQGGVNFEQTINSYAEQMAPGEKDQYFFQFLAEVLPVEGETYRTGFRIWQHHITWLSHNCERDGYIFMGNPAAKSTTQPQQHFYIYFMPIFEPSPLQSAPLDDEVCIWMTRMDEELKQAVSRYGAAIVQERIAPTDQKQNYTTFRRRLYNIARDVFNKQFYEKTEVEYRGNRMPLQTMQGADRADSKIQTIDAVVEYIMDPQFTRENDAYPKFTTLNVPYGRGNCDNLVKNAKEVIISPQNYNTTGVAMLTSLGLYNNGRLDTSHSQYAQAVRSKLESVPAGQVINRADLLEPFYENIFWTKDTHMDAELEFLVLATMTALGEIELVMQGGLHITALSIDQIRNIAISECANFTHISRPRTMNIAAVKELFIQVTGHDLSNQMNDPATFTQLCAEAKMLSQKAAKMEHDVTNGITIAGVEIVSAADGFNLSHIFTQLKDMCDQIQRYNTEVKMRNMPWQVSEIRDVFEKGRKKLDEIEGMTLIMRQMETEVSYFRQAMNLVTDSALLQDMTTVMNKIPSMLHANDQVRSQFRNEVQSVKQRYAQWYISAYTKAHISPSENQKKQAIMESREKVVCEELAAAGVFNHARYKSWLDEMNCLKPSDPNVTLSAVMDNPYQGFNPKQDIVPTKTLSELKDEINVLYQEFCRQIKDMVNDPNLTQNADILTSTQKSLLTELQTGAIEVSGSNVPMVVIMLNQLMSNFVRVEIDYQTLQSKFGGPLPINRVKDFFNDLIDQKCHGLNPSKVRIIFK